MLYFNYIILLVIQEEMRVGIKPLLTSAVAPQLECAFPALMQGEMVSLLNSCREKWEKSNYSKMHKNSRGCAGLKFPTAGL